MTTIAIWDHASEQATVPARLSRGARLWAALVRRHEARVLKRRLYNIEPRLLLDMGLDPALVYDSYAGTLGEVHGDGFRGLGPLAVRAGR